ncbi:MAG TPA: flagellar basal body L-ring protein FlgH [Alphaproteobacteria bacterium]|nr:flagellar basal body L-ring protein FlgH [Alphaproteobacteria bacterium]
MKEAIRRVLVGAFGVAALALGSGCTMLGDLAQIGEAPPLTRIQNPKSAPNYRKVSMPMPRQLASRRQANSLWRPGARAFFKDQRAARVGDIITIDIDISDSAKFNNTTKRARKGAEGAQAQALAGYESQLKTFLPKGVNPSALINASSTGSSEGTGTIDRGETVKLKVAAVVTQILPNGNLVVHGRQEMRVNYEMRELQVAGVIRRADITSANTIEFAKIAEARIAYGGRGHITRAQAPRFGHQLFDIMFPF